MVSTAAPLYVLLRIKNGVKTKDSYFVHDYWKQILFFFWIFPLLISFGFFPFFYFFWIFPFSIFFLDFFFLIDDFKKKKLFLLFDLVQFASDADCTWLNLVSPRMLIAQDLVLVSPRMLLAQDLLLVCLECWLHRTWSCFASNANCTGLNLVLYIHLDLPLTASLVALWLCHACLLDWTYTSDASFLKIYFLSGITLDC